MATPTTTSPSSFTLTLSPFILVGVNTSTTTTTTTTTSSSSTSADTTSYFPTGASISSNTTSTYNTSYFPTGASISSNTTSTYNTSYFPTGASSSSTSAWAACQYDAAHSNEDLRLPLALFYGFFFLVGLAGNALALWVFLVLQNRRPGGGGGGHLRRNSVRVLLINCAAADLVLLACLPFRVYYHLNGNRWGLGSSACRLVGNLFYMNMYISITLLGLIGLDRCLRLSGGGGRSSGAGTSKRTWCQGWSRGGHDARRSWAVCGGIWLLSLAALVPMVAAPEGNEEAGHCFQYKQRRQSAGKAYFNVALVLLFWAVFATLAVCYGCIAVRLLRASRDAPGLPNARRYGRTARKSFFVLFLFAVCFGPYHAFRPVYVASQLDPALSCGRAAAVDRTNEVMLLLSAFNSCLDPVMYFLLSGSMRKSAIRVLAGQLGHKRLYFLNEATSNSSTAESRRPSQLVASPNTLVTGGGGLLAARLVPGATVYDARRETAMTHLTKSTSVTES